MRLCKHCNQPLTVPTPRKTGGVLNNLQNYLDLYSHAVVCKPCASAIAEERTAVAYNEWEAKRRR